MHIVRLTCGLSAVDANRIAIAQLGGVQAGVAALAALAAHVGVATVQESGCTALANLALNGKCQNCPIPCWIIRNAVC